MRRGRRASKTKKVTIVLPQAPSEGATPCSSVVPSAYVSEDESSDYEAPPKRLLGGPSHLAVQRLTLQDFHRKKPVVRALPVKKPVTDDKPFRFLDLPTELRLRIYEYHFGSTEKTIDLGRGNWDTYGRQLRLIRTCKKIYNEASHLFYSTHTFRLFPTGTQLRYKETRKTLLTRVGPNQRQDMRSLELCLGPHWSRPPRGWVVTEAMGLKDCRDVRVLRVHVQLDTSQEYLAGYAVPGSYEAFSRDLLRSVLRSLPCVEAVELDAEIGVRKDCLIMRHLLEATRAAGKQVLWGPKRGWRND